MAIGLPEIDGTEAIRQIRSRNKPKRIPNLAATVHRHKADQDRIVESGTNAILFKPCREEEVLAKLRTLLLQKQYPAADSDADLGNIVC